LNADLIRRVWERAGDRCEYGQLPSAFHPAPFQIDHIIARQHGGKTELENLALACIHCNRFKGPNVAGLDPDTREIVRLFHPRRDSWADHFVWDGPELKARTQMGRATIAVLVINDPEVVAVRRVERGVFQGHVEEVDGLREVKFHSVEELLALVAARHLRSAK
jgi:hypothetical protein